MLEFFRKYQRFFFIFVTVIIIASFSFSGTFSPSLEKGEPEEVIIGKTIEETPLGLFEQAHLSRLISTDKDDYIFGIQANFSNDGVIRKDFLETGLGELLVKEYFDSFKDLLSSRLERAKRFRPYCHPRAPLLSAEAAWRQFLPSISTDLSLLKAEELPSPFTFSLLRRLYLAQSHLPPEFLRQYLLSTHQRFKKLPFDSRLQSDDLSLFGFHSASDWFGKDFIDLASLFILNTAAHAEKMGYVVSEKEAEGDLLRNFEASIKRLQENGIATTISFQEHLSSLGFDLKKAAASWRKVLLFRRYFNGLSNATFVDKLPYTDFASYALETAAIDLYKWPKALQLQTYNDWIELETYLHIVSSERDDPLSFPSAFTSLDAVENSFPELVQTLYQVKIAEISKTSASLTASLKEVWQWQLEEKNWPLLRAKLPSLPQLASREERFTALEKLDPSSRTLVDAIARENLLKEQPERLQKALQNRPLVEKVLAVSKGKSGINGVKDSEKFLSLLERASCQDQEALFSLGFYSDDEEHYFSIQEVSLVDEKHLLTFQEAKTQGILSEIAEKILEDAYLKIRQTSGKKFQTKEGKWLPFSSVKEEIALTFFKKVADALELVEKKGEEERSFYPKARLACLTRKAYQELINAPESTHWVKNELEPPLTAQFKLEKQEKSVQRLKEEEWMKEDVFVMMPKDWSPIHISDDGEISFFYLKEKTSQATPIFEQIAFGKEILSQDAKRYLAEKLITLAKKKNAIVIPVQKEESHELL